MMRARRQGAGQPSRSAAERGFTLIEVLIAFVIAAMAAAAVVRATTGAVVSSRAAARYDEAVTRAESHLASLAAVPLVDSDRQGDEGNGYRWHVRIAAAGAASPSSQLRSLPGGTVTLYRITVTVSWRDGDSSRSVRLDSARLGPVG